MNGSVPRKESNHKALAGALATILLWALGRGIEVISAPPDAEVIGAMRALVEAISSAIIGYGIVWMGPRNVIRLVPLCVAGVIVVGCAGADKAADWTADKAAFAVDEGCEGGMGATAMALRRDFVGRVNEKTTTGNWTPTDCDGDGLPDFEIDADGQPIAP